MGSSVYMLKIKILPLHIEILCIYELENLSNLITPTYKPLCTSMLLATLSVL
jgi:hypothetical protein